jgi:hypothetical protein
MPLDVHTWAIVVTDRHFTCAQPTSGPAPFNAEPGPKKAGRLETSVARLPSRIVAHIYRILRARGSLRLVGHGMHSLVLFLSRR